MKLLNEIFKALGVLAILLGSFWIWEYIERRLNRKVYMYEDIFGELLHKRQFYEELVKLIKNEGGITNFLLKTKSVKKRVYSPEQFKYLIDELPFSLEDYDDIQDSHFEILEIILQFSSVIELIKSYELEKAPPIFKHQLLFWIRGEGLSKELRKTFKNTKSIDLEMELFGNTDTSY